jgi:hypothetical protein
MRPSVGLASASPPPTRERDQSMQWRSPPKTDDEFVETVRKTVTRFDRWKPWLILLVAVLNLAPVVGTLILLALLEGMLQQFANLGIQPNAKHVWWFLSVGVAFGVGIGHSIHSFFTQLAQFVSGMRTERLLLRHYGAHQEHRGEESSSLSHEDHSEDSHS